MRHQAWLAPHVNLMLHPPTQLPCLNTNCCCHLMPSHHRASTQNAFLRACWQLRPVCNDALKRLVALQAAALAQLRGCVGAAVRCQLSCISEVEKLITATKPQMQVCSSQLRLPPEWQLDAVRIAGVLEGWEAARLHMTCKSKICGM